MNPVSKSQATSNLMNEFERNKGALQNYFDGLWQNPLFIYTTSQTAPPRKKRKGNTRN